MTQVVGLAKWVAQLLGKKPPRVIAASFFSLSAFIILFGFVRGYKPREIFLALLALVAISLVALGLRWLEKRCPAPSADDVEPAADVTGERRSKPFGKSGR